MGAQSSQSSNSEKSDKSGSHQYQSGHQFEEDLQFIMSMDSPIFGPIQIFKMKQKPHEYIMKKTYRNALQNESLEHSNSSKALHKNIVGAEYIENRIQNEACGKSSQLVIYCRYYNFTLQDAISKKIKLKSNFRQGDIFYVAKNLLEIFKFVSHKGYYKIFHTNKIFLSPQGFIRVYLWKHIWRNQAIYKTESECEVFGGLREEEEIEFNPEKQIQFQVKNKGVCKDDIGMDTKTTFLRDIGIVLLSMITLSKQSEYYLDCSNSINSHKIKFFLCSYKDLNNQSLNIFKELLKGMIIDNWSFDKIEQELGFIGKIYQLEQQFSIKLIRADEKEECTTSRAISYDEPSFVPTLQKISKSYLIAGKINLTTRQKK